MLSLGLEAFAQSKTNTAADATHQATLSEIHAAVERRAQEWSLALSTAVGEYAHGEKQLVAARIALDLANFQLTSHDKETEFAAQRLDFLKSKDTRLAHQDWLKQEVGLLLGQYYQHAFDLCKRAQQVYRFNTGDPSATFVEFGYFDKSHHGLLSGERLALAMRKMARAHRDQQRYEYALSKPISLAQLDPMALISLRATGSCEFDLPESEFDADFPGHFMRRIRSVAVTIPCVAGPYTTINATLTLLNSRIRRSNAVSPAYAEQPDGRPTVHLSPRRGAFRGDQPRTGGHRVVPRAKPQSPRPLREIRRDQPLATGGSAGHQRAHPRGLQLPGWRCATSRRRTHGDFGASTKEPITAVQPAPRIRQRVASRAQRANRT
jgi:hypothetical protein